MTNNKPIRVDENAVYSPEAFASLAATDHAITESEMKKNISILHLEDDPADTELVQEILDAEFACQITHVKNWDEFCDALTRQEYTLILSDHNFPGGNGLRALQLAQQECSQTPFIFVSGMIDEDVAIASLTQGATDYVLKHKLARLVPAVKRALRESAERQEHRRVEVALEDEHRLLQTLIENIPDPVYAKDLAGQYVLVNQAKARNLGVACSEAIGKTASDFFSPEFAALYTADEQRIMASGQPMVNQEQVSFDAEDNQHCMVFSKVPLRNGQGKIIGLVAIEHDITKRKEAEEALVESGARFRALFDVSPDAIVLIDPHDRWTILDCNKAACQMNGYTRDELIGQSIDLLNLTPGIPTERAEYLEKIRQNDVRRLETFHRRKDGTTFPVEVATSMITLSGRDVVLGIDRDITERKQAEVALHESEESYRAVTESAKDAIITTDSRGMVITWNRGAQEIFGYAAAEMIGNSIARVVPGGYGKAFRDGMAHLNEGGAPHKMTKPIDLHGLRKDGSEFPAEMSLSSWKQTQGNFYSAIIRDITERKQAQDALAQERNLLRTLIDNLPDNVYVKDIECRYVVNNPSHVRSLGATRQEDVLGKTSFDFFPQPRAAQYYAEEQEILRSGQPMIEKEDLSVNSVTGQPVWLLAKKAPILDSQGQVVGIVGVSRNITERKLAEEALRESEERYRRLIELLPDGVIIHSEGRVVFGNPASAKIIGAASSADLIGKPVIEFVQPEYREMVMQRIKQSLGEGTNLPIADEKFIKLDGTPIDVQVTAIPFSYSGKPAMLTVFNDITERKHAEAALHDSEERFRAWIENSSDLVTVVGLDGTIQYESPSMEHLLGYKPDELIGTNAFDLIHPDDSERVMEIFAQNIQTPESAASVAFRIRHRDGSWRIYEGVGKSYLDEQGQMAGLINSRDITERKHTEELLRQQKEYFEALVQHTPVAVVSLDANAKIATSNPAFEKLFGYTESEIKGQNIDDLVTTDESRARALANSQQAEQSLVHVTDQRRKKDGTLIDTEILGVPILIDGKRIGSLVIYHDITVLTRARREAEEGNRAKSAFLATMSHEIRTPMNGVIGMTGLLLDTPLTAEQKDYALTIRDSGDALLTIINDILDFSKIEAGRLELESHPFDIADCVEGALDMVAARASDKKIDLAYLVDDLVPRTLLGDAPRVRQVLINLLGNAIKFTEAGEVNVKVTAYCIDDTGSCGHAPVYEVRFAVRDTGIGIPPDRMDRLFRSFSQVDASTTRKYGGTGLGLAICKRLSEMMGGRTWVESEIGKGSTFYFTIQAQASPSQPRIHLRAHQPQFEGKRVLIVDDIATNRTILSRQTQAWGMLPRDTAFPLEALAWIRRGDPFDIAILDMMMPEMDGMTLAQEIRRYRSAQGLPLVLLSSLGRHEAGAEKLDVAYLSKPIKPSQLYNSLASIFVAKLVAPMLESEQPLLDSEMAKRLPLQILLAEDHPVNQKLVLQILKKMGYRADLAANGLEVLQALERQPYDVILMDVQMPEMDGLEATRRICQQWSKNHRPRIIAMTANAMVGDREECMEAGMDDYISKPIEIREMQSALELSGLQAKSRGVPAAQETEPALIDSAVLSKLRTLQEEGQPDFVQEMIGIYLQTAPATIHSIHSAIEQANAGQLKQTAHTLKGNSGMIGARQVAEWSKQLETMGRDGNLGGAMDVCAKLERSYERTVQAIAIRPELSGRGS